jgi:hypothetical protein
MVVHTYDSGVLTITNNNTLNTTEEEASYMFNYTPNDEPTIYEQIYLESDILALHKIFGVDILYFDQMVTEKPSINNKNVFTFRLFIMRKHIDINITVDKKMYEGGQIYELKQEVSFLRQQLKETNGRIHRLEDIVHRLTKQNPKISQRHDLIIKYGSMVGLGIKDSQWFREPNIFRYYKDITDWTNISILQMCGRIITNIFTGDYLHRNGRIDEWEPFVCEIINTIGYNINTLWIEKTTEVFDDSCSLFYEYITTTPWMGEKTYLSNDNEVYFAGLETMKQYVDLTIKCTYCGIEYDIFEYIDTRKEEYNVMKNEKPKCNYDRCADRLSIVKKILQN